MAYRVLVLYHCGAVCKKLLPEALQPPQGLTLRAVLDERTGGNLFVVLRHQAGASRERARRGAQHLGEWSTECWVSFPFPGGGRSVTSKDLFMVSLLPPTRGESNRRLLRNA